MASKYNIMSDLMRLYPQNPDSCRFEVLCNRADYSASRISRAVEDCDAHVLNLNVTSDIVDDNNIVVDLRVEHRNKESVIRSLERYGYVVIPVGESSSEGTDDAKEDEERTISALERFLQI